MKTFFPLILLGFFFLAAAYAAQTYEASIAALIGSGVSGVLLYVVVAAIGTVVAPLSSLPLVPIASGLWGAPLAALASQLGWFIGGIIAFALSRRFGRPLVEKLISKEKLARAEERLPQERQFWSIFLLSMTLPTDVLSYTLGLFKSVRWKIFVPAMLLGNIPFAFVFAYTGTLPFSYQLVLVPVVVLLVIVWNRRRMKKDVDLGMGMPRSGSDF